MARNREQQTTRPTTKAPPSAAANNINTTIHLPNPGRIPKKSAISQPPPNMSPNQSPNVSAHPEQHEPATSRTEHDFEVPTGVVTTQCGICILDTTIDKRYDTLLPHLHYNKIKGARFYTVTLFTGTLSIRSTQVAQVCSDGKGYCLFFPLASKAHGPSTVWNLVQHLNSIPKVIVSDGGKEVTSEKWDEQM
jgi:hypothetical protein